MASHRRKYAMLQGKRCLDDAGDARRGVQVADGRLGRTEPRESASCGGAAECLAEGSQFNRVTDWGAGAVRLNVLDRLRLDAGELLRLDDDGGVAFDAGGEIADLAGPVVVDGRRFDNRVDVISVAERIFQAAKHDDAGAAGEDGAGGLGIESAADAILREDFAVAVEVAGAVGHFDGHAAGEGHVAFVRQQGLGCEVDGDKAG